MSDSLPAVMDTSNLKPTAGYLPEGIRSWDSPAAAIGRFSLNGSLSQPSPPNGWDGKARFSTTPISDGCKTTIPASFDCSGPTPRIQSPPTAPLKLPHRSRPVFTPPAGTKIYINHKNISIKDTSGPTTLGLAAIPPPPPLPYPMQPAFSGLPKTLERFMDPEDDMDKTGGPFFGARAPGRSRLFRGVGMGLQLVASDEKKMHKMLTSSIVGAFEKKPGNIPAKQQKKKPVEPIVRRKILAPLPPIPLDSVPADELMRKAQKNFHRSMIRFDEEDEFVRYLPRYLVHDKLQVASLHVAEDVRMGGEDDEDYVCSADIEMEETTAHEDTANEVSLRSRVFEKADNPKGAFSEKAEAPYGAVSVKAEPPKGATSKKINGAKNGVPVTAPKPEPIEKNPTIEEALIKQSPTPSAAPQVDLSELSQESMGLLRAFEAQQAEAFRRFKEMLSNGCDEVEEMLESLSVVPEVPDISYGKPVFDLSPKNYFSNKQPFDLLTIPKPSDKLMLGIPRGYEWLCTSCRLVFKHEDGMRRHFNDNEHDWTFWCRGCDTIFHDYNMLGCHRCEKCVQERKWESAE